MLSHILLYNVPVYSSGINDNLLDAVCSSSVKLNSGQGHCLKLSWIAYRHWAVSLMIASSFIVVCLINVVSHASLKRECKN